MDGAHRLGRCRAGGVLCAPFAEGAQDRRQVSSGLGEAVLLTGATPVVVGDLDQHAGVNEAAQAVEQDVVGDPEVACDHTRALLLAGPAGTRSWISGRYGPLLDRSAREIGRGARLVTDRELQLLHALRAADSRPSFTDTFRNDHQEAV